MWRFSFVVISAALVTFTGTDPVRAASEQKTSDSRTMERADADMRDVLKKLDELNGKPLDTLTPDEARKQPSAADAVAALLKDQGKNLEQMKQQSGVLTRDMTYPGAAGDQIPARIYTPEGAEGQALPLILYIHGGGWVVGNLDSHDATPRALAKKAGAIVVSVHYRQAPEHKFPASHDDTFAAYKWVLENAKNWGDPKRVAVAGEGAGGNMAINVAMAARDQKLQQPVHIVAIYPVAGTSFDTPSYQQNDKAKPLSAAAMEWFLKQETSSEAELKDPRLDLLRADLKGLPPTTIVTADIDPLLSEGKVLAERLSAAGGKSSLKNFEGVTHEFFGMEAVVKDAAEAQDFVAQELKQAFSGAVEN